MARRIAHAIQAMMTCLNPSYLIQYSGELFYIQIKQGLSLIKGVNQSLTTLTKGSRAALVQFVSIKALLLLQKVFKTW